VDQYTTVAELREVLERVRSKGQKVGMVGTSGAMHQGHGSLIERSATENDLTALYWGGGGGFDWMTSRVGYERDAARDLALAERAGCDIVFVPANDELFPREPMTRVSLPAMSTKVPQLEDPAHLDLIAMVMCKLWNIFGPCRSYFGEKDWQQLVMFKRLADDLYWPIEVVGSPTIRESDGLAVSSRNSKLTAEQRATAPVIYRALRRCSETTHYGVRTSAELANEFAAEVGDRASVVYFTPVEAETMAPLDRLRGSVRLLASIELGSVRLLDNVGVEIGGR
jgi:pantoate--beta-alanine ligase